MALLGDRRLATAYHKLSGPPVLLCLLGAVSNCVLCWVDGCVYISILVTCTRYVCTVRYAVYCRDGCCGA